MDRKRFGHRTGLDLATFVSVMGNRGDHKSSPPSNDATPVGNPVMGKRRRERTPFLFRCATLVASHTRSFQRCGQGRPASTNRRVGPCHCSTQNKELGAPHGV
jgi:hypothetical protein